MRILGCHSDLLVDVFRRRRNGERDVLRRTYIGDLRAGGVEGLVVSVGGDTANLCPLRVDRRFDSVAAMLGALDGEIADAGGEVATVGSADELLMTMDTGAIALVPALEGTLPVGGHVANLERLYELGVRQVG